MLELLASLTRVALIAFRRVPAGFDIAQVQPVADAADSGSVVHTTWSRRVQRRGPCGLSELGTVEGPSAGRARVPFLGRTSGGRSLVGEHFSVNGETIRAAFRRAGVPTLPR